MHAPRWLLAGLAIALTAAPALADTILLKNGRRIDGKVISDKGDSIVFEVMDGQGRITIHKAAIGHVYKGDEQPPPKREGIFPARSDTLPAGAPVATPRTPLASAATGDLEQRLRALGPTREELLARLQPTPAEADELAHLERALASGAPASERLAAKGRLALVVAARALSSPDRKARIGASQTIARLAADERTLPFILALGIPERLIDAAADDKDPASPVARQQARKALEAIAKIDPCDCPPAGTQELTADEQEKLAAWKSWWQKEQAELVAWEKPKDDERAQIKAELAGRGLGQYAEKGRIEVRFAASEEPSLPEPKLVLPRLVVTPPSAMTLRGEAKARALRFATAIENRGEGPLEVRRSGVGDTDLRAVQRVFARYPGDSRVVVEHETAVGTFLWHEAHKHWHLAPFARYELLDESFASALGARPAEKVSFCLRDSRPLGGGEAPGRYAECGREIQGISPGFADVHEDELAGQELPIGGVADGVYYVVELLTAGFESASTPEDRIAAAKVRIEGGKVTVLASLDGPAFLALQAKRAEALAPR